MERAKIISKLIDQKFESKRKFAEFIGIPPTTLQSILKRGVGKASIDNVISICKGLGITIDELEEMANQNNINKSNLVKEARTVYLASSNGNRLKRIPILGQIACGEPIYVEENFEGYKIEPEESLPSGSLFYLQVKGDSMEPTIPDGSMVLIREQPNVESNEIAAVLLNGDTEATLKRVRKQNGTVILVPDNPKYTPIVINENTPARIIGKAIRFTIDL